MPIDLVIDERDGPKPDMGTGDSNNNAAAAAAGRASADTTHTDGASTPDVVSTRVSLLYFFPSSVLPQGNYSHNVLPPPHTCPMVELCDASAPQVSTPTVFVWLARPLAASPRTETPLCSGEEMAVQGEGSGYSEALGRH